MPGSKAWNYDVLVQKPFWHQKERWFTKSERKRILYQAMRYPQRAARSMQCLQSEFLLQVLS